MKTKSTLKAFLIASTILHFTLYTLHSHAAVIQQVIVRQQWPWSTDIKVEFKLAEVTSPVDISVKAFNGNVELDNSKLVESITGDLYGISESGIGQFVIDPVKAFGNAKVAIADFRVELEVTDSSANLNEVLYKVFSLTNSSEAVVNITRKELLNRKYGSVVTDYSEFGEGFTTSLSDVLVWTAVTNDVKYKTTHLVMRRIPAGTFICGGNENSPGISVAISNDYFIGVFEMTQRQCAYISAARGAASYFNNVSYRDTRPRENVAHADIRGQSANAWPYPDSPANASYVGAIRIKTGVSSFDLPTEAQWERAARGGTSTIWNNGETSTTSGRANPVIGKLGRTQYTGGYIDNGTTATAPAADCTTVNGTAEVGSYAPNAFGLYDCHGNVMELCLDRYADWNNITANILLNGTTEFAATSHVAKGADWSRTPINQYIDKRYSVGQQGRDKTCGFRLCCSAE